MSKLLYKHILVYYFSLTAVFGLLNMLSIHLFEYAYVLLLTIVVCSLKYFKTNVTDGFDYLVLGTVIFISFVGYVKNPYKDLFSAGFLWEILPMLSFFIGRDKRYSDDLVFQKGVWGVMVTGFLGLLLYIFQPSWYLAFKLSVLSNVTEHMWLEMTRLSGFWQYPYWVSYGVAIIYIYILGNIVINNRYKNKLSILALFFLFVISLLTQQRASIGGIVLSTLVYTIIYKGISKRQLFSAFVYLVAIVASLYAAYRILFSFLDVSRLDFMLSKFDVFSDSNSNFLNERADIFDNMKDIPISLIGDGLGLYSHGADAKGLTHYITDQGYMKMLYETGILGFSLRLFIILYTLKKGILNFKKCHVESLVILVVLISLFGANSLSALQMHNIVFWYCCGLIWKKTRIEYRIIK